MSIPREIYNLILIQLPIKKLILINKYYNNYKYLRLIQTNLKISPFTALRRFKNLQLNLITHSKYEYFKNMEIPDNEQYVFSISNAPRNKKRHTIPPEIFKNLKVVKLHCINDMKNNDVLLYIIGPHSGGCGNCIVNLDGDESFKFVDESYFRKIKASRFYDRSAFV